MAKYPKAAFHSLGSDPAHQPTMTSHDGVILHTMAGTIEGTESLFKQGGYVGVESHFGVAGDGSVVQWVDTARTADANLDGNPFYVSIETEDMGPGFPMWSGSNVPAWTDAQLHAISELVAWACITHQIPATQMPNSEHRKGIGWHRLGINSSPPFQEGWRTPNGQLWSTSAGKVCPGDRRIAQIKSIIIPRVQAIINGGTAMDNVTIDLSQDLTPVLNEPGDDRTVGDAFRRIAALDRKLDILLERTAP